jgi:hypothetical protein
LNRRRAHPRAGATIVELAITLPVVFLFLIGILVGGLGVFRYHEVAALAHEGARWASVHGNEYAKQAKKPRATSEDVFNNVIRPRGIGLDASKLSSEVTWQDDGARVLVTVRYQWTPEAFFEPIVLSSTAEMLVTY